MFKAYSNLLITMLLIFISYLSLTSVGFAMETDPTRPFNVSSFGTTNILKNDNGFKLSSIIYANGIHKAIINGKIYKERDYVGEYRLAVINRHNVILRSDSKELKIDIFKSKGFKSNVIDNTVAN